VSVSVCLSICLSLAAFPHYCTDPDVTWWTGRGCPIVVHCLTDLQSVHGFRCCNNTHVCKLTALCTANLYSAEREMSASACTRSMAGWSYCKHSNHCEMVMVNIVSCHANASILANTESALRSPEVEIVVVVGVVLSVAENKQTYTVKAKFHYAILVADRSEAGGRPAASWNLAYQELAGLRHVSDQPRPG